MFDSSRARTSAFVLAWVLSAPAGCSALERTLPPYAEALIVVDTDLPVPQIAGRLRVDLFDQNGTWYESRDTGLPDVQNWPPSFSVYSANEASDTQVLVRLRVYPDGYVRDYVGEQYVNQNGPLPNAAGTNDTGPRLMSLGADGGIIDSTPPFEPKPLVTVDRLVLLRLRPAVRGRVRVMMSGECAGTMSLLSQTPPYQTPAISQAATCIDTENALHFLTEATLETDMSIPPSTSLGTFGVGQPCSPNAPTDPRAQCVSSGVFILGDASVIDLGPPYDGYPERVVAIDRFWVDRNEVTVAQLRAAVAAGFYKGMTLPIGAHDGPLGQSLPTDQYPFDEWCTWSTTPMGREDDPVSCVAWDFARDYCQFEGGNLITEAEWEYAASAAARPYKTFYPWGNTDPSCTDALFDRYTLGPDIPSCQGYPVGPQPVTTTPNDKTPGGILNMGGSQAELMLDSLAEYSAPCWMQSSLHNPSCIDPSNPVHALRGGAWPLGAGFLDVAVRNDSGTPDARFIFGFRCTFPSAPNHP